MNDDTVGPASARRWALTWILVGVLVGGLALRLIYLAELRSDVLFDHPALDEDRYLHQALAIAGKEPPEPARAYWQPPGIAYVLAASLWVTDSLLWPRLLQALVSVATGFLLYLCARRFRSERLAVAAAGLVACHGILIFESGNLLPATWVAFFDLLALLLLLLAGERSSWRWTLAAGAALGVSALFTPTILLFVPVAIGWLAMKSRGRRRALLVGCLLAGLVVPIAPVTHRNYRAGGELVLVSSNGGLNFYLGNNPDYQETLALRPGRRWLELVDEPLRAGIEAPGAQSSYFYRKAWSDIGARPLAAAARGARKLVLFFNGHEIPRDGDLYAARDQSRLLSALVWPSPLTFPDGLLLPLALVGLAVSWRRRRELFLLLGFVAVQALVLSGFFVTSRYRVPAIPVLGFFALVGAGWAIDLWRGGGGRVRALLATGLVLLVAGSSLPLRETRASYAGELHFYRGLACARTLHDPAAAAKHFQRATAVDPDDPRAWFELGNLFPAWGSPDDAVAAWLRAAEADPWDSRPRRRAGLLLARLGRYGDAIAAYQGNLASAQREPAHYAHEYFNLGWLHGFRGEYPLALEALGQAAELDPAYFAEYAPSAVAAQVGESSFGSAGFFLDLGDLLRDRGLGQVAGVAWRRAAELAPPDSDILQQIDQRLR